MLLTSQQLAAQESQNLAPYATLNKNTQGRQHPEPTDPYRTPFQRDRDRIIHTRSFRRLHDKTQVFISGTGDHFRNRLTHTMEVAQISRDVARTLALNEDLAESIALAHDLGHTPFGHAGETALNQLMQEQGLSFEHNEQSKRTIEILETPYPHFPGLNLSRETIDGLIKHQSPYDNATKTFRFLPSLEAQVVNLADEIAYTAHDTDDGLRSRIISTTQLASIELWQEACELACRHHNVTQPSDLSRDRIISKLISLIVHDLYEATEKTIQEKQIDSPEKVHHHQGPVVHFSTTMRQKLAPLRKFLYEKLYFSAQVSTSMTHGQKMIKTLFDHYLSHPENLPENFRPSPNPENNKNLPIAIKDYIAGMTDSYAIAQFNKI